MGKGANLFRPFPVSVSGGNMLESVKNLVASIAPTIRKAVVAFLVPLALAGLAQIPGVELEPALVEVLITSVVTALIVFLVPNAKPELDK